MNPRKKEDCLGERKSNRKFGGEDSPPFFYIHIPVPDALRCKGTDPRKKRAELHTVKETCL